MATRRTTNPQRLCSHRVDDRIRLASTSGQDGTMDLYRSSTLGQGRLWKRSARLTRAAVSPISSAVKVRSGQSMIQDRSLSGLRMRPLADPPSNRLFNRSPSQPSRSAPLLSRTRCGHRMGPRFMWFALDLMQDDPSLHLLPWIYPTALAH